VNTLNGLDLNANVGQRLQVDGQGVFTAVPDIPDVQTNQIELYLQADYLNNNFANGDVITDWVGAVNGFTVGDSSNGSNPIVETDVVNGFAGANLAGSAHLTSGGLGGQSAAFNDNTAYTQIFVAVKQSSGNVGNLWAPDDADPNTTEWNSGSPYPFYPRSPNANLGGHHGWSKEPTFGIGISNADFTAGKAFVWTHRYNGSNEYDIRINEGLESGSNTNNNFGFESIQGFHVIGTATQNSSHPADVFWIECGLWTTRLTDTEVQEVESFLVSKYNIDTSSL
jgi:hypothetical protein